MKNTKRPWKPGQPFHPKTGRPFRGPTPPKVYQTTDIGSGKADWLATLKRKKKETTGKTAQT